MVAWQIPAVLLGATVLDLLAAVALAWLVARSGRERDAMLAERRAAHEPAARAEEDAPLAAPGSFAAAGMITRTAS